MAENPRRFTENTPSNSTSSLTKECLTVLVQTLMDIEVSQILSASRYERSESRRAYRNGYRQTVWKSSIGEIDLQIPKLRRGTYYPDQLLNDGTVSDGLVQLVRQSLVQGVKPRHIADAIGKMNLMTLSAYELHQICDALHLVIDRAKNRRNLSSTPEQVEFASHKRQLDSIKEERKFWKDFSRRMAHAGLFDEDDQSILSGVNPYARIEATPTEIMRPDFDKHRDMSIYYINDNTRIA